MEGEIKEDQGGVKIVDQEKVAKKLFTIEMAIAVVWDHPKGVMPGFFEPWYYWNHSMKFQQGVWLLSWFKKPLSGTCGMILHTIFKV